MDENYANRLKWFRQFKEKIKGSTKTLVIGIDVAKDSHHAFFGIPDGRTIQQHLANWFEALLK